MKIKVFIVDQDQNYTSRALKTFKKYYAEKTDLSVFSDKNELFTALESGRADVVLADEKMKVDVTKIPEGVSYGILTEKKDSSSGEKEEFICKYQDVDTLYKVILGIYTEGAVLTAKEKLSGKVTVFTSAQGGTGTSTAAAAYAYARAGERKRVFYLNLEKMGDCNDYFSGEGTKDFTCVMKELKNHKSDFIIKIESAVRKDVSGVEFFAPVKDANDMLRLDNDNISSLLCGIDQLKGYDEIVIDLPSYFDDGMNHIFEKYADHIIYVCDGSALGNKKFYRFLQVMKRMEQDRQIKILNKITLLYNQFDPENIVQMDDVPVGLLGGIRRFGGVSGRALLENIQKTGILKQM